MNKYYTASVQQLIQNRRYTNRDLAVFNIPLLIDDWKLGPTDRHLNLRANGIVMAALADSLLREEGSAHKTVR